MPDPRRDRAARALARTVLPAALMLVLGACSLLPSPSSTVVPSLPATPSPSVAASQRPAESATTEPTAEPTPTPEPPLSLALPDGRDRRRVQVRLAPDLPIDGDGRIVVTVTNLSDRRIGELVLRWPTPLRDTIFLAPFQPSPDRTVDGGPPLWQEWTKWVEGPGEKGEPAGTTSLGWGPLDPGATLTIPLDVTRNARGTVAFDLQLLSGEELLHLEDGDLAELRVEVP